MVVQLLSALLQHHKSEFSRYVLIYFPKCPCFSTIQIYASNVALCRWRFACHWGTYFDHLSHSRPPERLCQTFVLGILICLLVTQLWFHRTAAAVTRRYGQCCVTQRACKVRLDINSLKPTLRKFFELVKSKRRQPFAQQLVLISQKTWNRIQHIHAKRFVLQSQCDCICCER